MNTDVFKHTIVDDCTFVLQKFLASFLPPLSPVVRSEFGIALVDGTGTGEGNLSTISHLGFPK
jgi:hypothetical protein